MTYYVPLAGGAGTAIFVLSDQNGRKLAEVQATMRDDHPLTLSPAPASGPLLYPSYVVATAHDVTEVIEHRKRDGFFYITDDPQVRRKFGVAP